MIDYIKKALNRINKEAEKVLNNNNTYYQNRIIDLATRLYVEDFKNAKSLYAWVSPDVIKDELRAAHYGKPIGSIIGLIHSPKDKHYYKKVARVKKEIKKIVRATVNK